MKKEAWIKNDINAKDRSSQRWKDLRESVIIDQGCLCFFCKGLAEEVHHKKLATPENFFDRSNLVALCCKCHLMTHNAYRMGVTFDDLTKTMEVNNAGC